MNGKDTISEKWIKKNNTWENNEDGICTRCNQHDDISEGLCPNCLVDFCIGEAVKEARQDERLKVEAELGKQSIQSKPNKLSETGELHHCSVCHLPDYFWKKGDDKACFSCRQLFSMTHDAVMKGDYQTRFTEGIHRQALGFVYHHCLDERSKLEAELEKWKQGYKERVSESTEKLLRIQQLEAEIVELKVLLGELKKYKQFHDHIKGHFENEHPDWEVECKICDKTISEIIQQLSSGGEVPTGIRKARSGDVPDSPKVNGLGTPKPKEKGMK
jgi:hypothetical protein